MRTPFAYLDAGSASAIVSIVLGGFAALGVAVRYRWNKLLVFLKIRKPLEDDDATVAPAPEASAPATADAPPREPVETK
jgi:hypothetical protein